ncbi:MAG: hypothetical protein II192_00925 [Clostridia bacterium]|nr:hypothetical protein [Clostridia bacterium]
MMSYEEYKQKVYELFMKDCLKNVSEEEKKKHLQENEDFIKNSYNDAVGDYDRYRDENKKLVFSDHVLLGGVVHNLDMLY